MLEAGPGVDRANGADGDDSILARGSIDWVLCYEGADRAELDELDMVFADCDTFARSGPAA